MDANWNMLAANILKAELKRKGLTYAQLQEKLYVLGINETTSGIKVKLSRGTFQFAFFLQCSKAIGLKNLNLDELHTESES
ncbi:DUF6471 domain-containing protein [Fluoribacter dumoffii]|uniref:DUF6471 domain-containing protein n=1 Tax=Fluoribacter dumoffii TaxID=463 RepID=UPI00026C770D|nr:DUF6471 domain-containing protein [Fluoribacter dumoffii]